MVSVAPLVGPGTTSGTGRSTLGILTTLSCSVTCRALLSLREKSRNSHGMSDRLHPMDAEQRQRIAREIAFERTLPDGLVEGTSIVDWQCFLDLVRSQGWRSEWGAGEAPGDATELFAEEDRLAVKMWPIESLQVNVFPNAETSIDFDFDSRELAGDGLDACFTFLRAVGRALEKTVLLKHEGVDAGALARYDPEADDIAAGERLSR